MKPYEDASYAKRHAEWHDIELSDVNHAQINYKI